MSIKKRLKLSSSILLLLFAVMIAVNWYGNRVLLEKSYYSYELEHELTHLQGVFRGVNEFIIDEGEPLSVEFTNKHLDGFDELHNELLAKVKDTELKDSITSDIDPMWKEIKDDVVSFMKKNPYISADDDQAMYQYGSLISKAKVLIDKIEELGDEAAEAAEITSRTVKTISYFTSSLSLIIFAVTALVLYNVFRSFSGSLSSMHEISDALEKGDLTIQTKFTTNDEFGILAKSFNNSLGKLKGMITNVREVVDIVLNNSTKVADSATVIANNAHEQSDKSAMAASSLEELSASFLHVAKNTSDAAASSKEAAELAFRGGEVVTETIKGINRISESVNSSAETIEALGRQSEQIGEIIKVIDDIAGQTNLLALNAAIEAARAGDQGRGFAVVADEVRKLAERTSKATTEIGDMIKKIQHDTALAVNSMKQGTEHVEGGVDMAHKAGESLQNIVASIQTVTGMIQQVATAAEEQTTTCAEVTGNIEAIAELARSTSESAEISSHATFELNALVQQLVYFVKQFHIDGAAVSKTDPPSVQPEQEGQATGG